MEAESDQLRVKRRSAKGKFTRQVRTVAAMVSNERSHSEVYVNWQSLQRLYDELQDRHEAFSETIDPKDEATYDEEDQWMEKCRETYVNVSMSMHDYIRNVSSNDQGNDADSSVSKSNIRVTTDERNAAKPETVGAANKTEIVTKENTEIGSAENSLQKKHAGDSEDRPSTFKLEFSQMPKFSGDVREYAVFRSDFKDLIEPKCSKRDAVTLLRNNLIGKPHELIKGMGNDYVAAWEFLDSVYGDPRVVADAVTYDITSFRPLNEDDDIRFCELCHLVRRSFNTLKDIGRHADLDNNHILAIIERKLARDDRKVWSRKVEEGKTPATLERLLQWMTIEMKARMRASALIRDGPQQPVNHVNFVSMRQDEKGGSVSHSQEMSHRCWVCKSSTHWVDECRSFKSMAPSERINLINENHACYCCLKRAGKNHTSKTCYRRRPCMWRSGHERCTQYHHTLLHPDKRTNTEASNGGLVGVTGVVSNSTMLPVLGVCVLGRQNDENVHKSANLLLDSGAQISFIRTQLAEELNLDGEDITITIHKVGGYEETRQTKRYNVCVQSLDSNHTTSIYAIGIPYITDDISSVTDLNEKATNLRIPLSDIHRGCGPVDLLVGLDCPQLHTGETKSAGNLVARRSPLGWVIFGTDGPISRSNIVLNIRVAQPVDSTNFSNTGTNEKILSVQHSPCRSEEINPLEIQEAKAKEESCVEIDDQCEVPDVWTRCLEDNISKNTNDTIKKHVIPETVIKKNNEYEQIYYETTNQLSVNVGRKKCQAKKVQIVSRRDADPDRESDTHYIVESVSVPVAESAPPGAKRVCRQTTTENDSRVPAFVSRRDGIYDSKVDNGIIETNDFNMKKCTGMTCERSLTTSHAPQHVRDYEFRRRWMNGGAVPVLFVLIMLFACKLTNTAVPIGTYYYGKHAECKKSETALLKQFRRCCNFANCRQNTEESVNEKVNLLRLTFTEIDWVPATQQCLKNWDSYFSQAADIYPKRFTKTIGVEQYGCYRNIICCELVLKKKPPVNACQLNTVLRGHCEISRIVETYSIRVPTNKCVNVKTPTD